MISKKPKLKAEDDRTVSIGGVSFLFRNKGCSVEELRDRRRNLADFFHRGKGDIICDVKVGALPTYPKDKTLFDAKNNWCLYKAGTEHIFETYKSSGKDGSKRIVRVCRVSDNCRNAKLYISPDADVDFENGFKDERSRWSLEQLMRIMGHLLFIDIAPMHGAILVHGSGIVLNGEGFIFLGKSGEGKSTIAKLWMGRRGVKVLSDDRLIIRRTGKDYYLYGTPWPGTAGM
ncbi:MAG: hypothetical protein JW800_01410, partial [Candidatus Omnitrophica bacterium]|nr:hypothetical protein [Candidatus Omnitrophota bacterium]